MARKPPVDSTKQNTAAQPSSEEIKLELEIKKLRRESSWFVPQLHLKDMLTIIVTAGIAGGTFWVAMSSGILDAKRLQLSAERERFETENIRAQAANQRLTEQTEQLTAQVNELRGQLHRIESARATLVALSKYEACEVTGTTDDGKFRVNISVKIVDGGPPVTVPNLENCLSLVSDLQSGGKVMELRIKNVRLSPRDMEVIGQLRTIETLVLENNNLDDDSLLPIGNLVRVSWLDLTKQPIRSLRPLAKLPIVSMLSLVDTKVDDSSFDINFACAGELRAIRLDGIGLSDSGIDKLKQFDNLLQIWLLNSQVTSAGLKELALQTNAFILVDRKVCSIEESRAISAMRPASEYREIVVSSREYSSE